MQEQEEIELSTEEEKGWLGRIKDSVYENWQTVLVAIIVLIVGVSAYNYNTKTGVNNPAPAATEEKTDNSQQNTNNAPATDQANTNNQEQKAEEKDQAAAEKQDQTTDTAKKDSEAATQTNSTEQKNKQTEESINTNTITVEGENYKVKAEKGEGITHLARKAINKYLEDNKDDEITDLHKIYIEDYLQNRTGKGMIKVGHEETFSKSMIEKAIASSKQLSQRSLDNLKKYSTAQ